MDIRIENSSKAEVFASIFQHMKLFTENINVMFEQERMFIQAMDSARVSIVEMYLPKSWFDRYENKTNGSIRIGINTTIMFKVLSTRDKIQSINLKYEGTDSDRLAVDFSSDSKTVFNKFFEIPLMDIDEELMEIPPMEYQAEFSLSSQNFGSLVSQMKLFGDTLQIECSEDKIQLSSVSVDVGKMNVNIPIEDLTSFAIDEGESLNLSFSITHLHSICAYSKVSKDVEICITNDYPIRLTYPLNENDAKFVFYLAPKINND
jgi:proliferating cell nuclear antigen